MKSVVKSTLFFAVMLSMAVGCQSKKTESSETKTDTTTIVESETVVSGDSATMMTDTTKVVMPDSAK